MTKKKIVFISFQIGHADKVSHLKPGDSTKKKRMMKKKKAGIGSLFIVNMSKYMHNLKGILNFGFFNQTDTEEVVTPAFQGQSYIFKCPLQRVFEIRMD